MNETIAILGIIVTVLLAFIGWVAANVVSMKVTVGNTETKIDNLVDQHSDHKKDIAELREKTNNHDSRLARLEGHRL